MRKFVNESQGSSFYSGEDLKPNQYKDFSDYLSREIINIFKYGERGVSHDGMYEIIVDGNVYKLIFDTQKINSIYKIKEFVKYFVVLVHKYPNPQNAANFVGVSLSSNDYTSVGHTIEKAKIDVYVVDVKLKSEESFVRLYSSYISHELKHLFTKMYMKDSFVSRLDDAIASIKYDPMEYKMPFGDVSSLYAVADGCSKKDVYTLINFICKSSVYLTYQEMRSYLENTIVQFIGDCGKHDIYNSSAIYNVYNRIKQCVYILQCKCPNSIIINIADCFRQMLDDDACFSSICKTPNSFVRDWCDWATKRLNYFFERARKQYTTIYNNYQNEMGNVALRVMNDKEEK